MNKDEAGRFMPSGQNENCLDGVVCPVCGQEDQFDIQIHGSARVNDYGWDDETVEWDNSSWCICGDCGYTGSFGEFNYCGDKTIPIADHVQANKIKEALAVPNGSKWLGTDGDIYEVIGKHWQIGKIKARIDNPILREADIRVMDASEILTYDRIIDNEQR